MRKPTLLFCVFLAIGLGYAALTLLGPADAVTLARYHLSQSKLHELSLTIVIPLLAIWLSAYYGFSSFRKYSQVIAKTDEGPAFREIALGLGFLAFSLPLNSLVSSLLSLLLDNHPTYESATTITRNYTALIFPLLAFMFISRGAEKLAHLTRGRLKRQLSPHGVVFFTIFVSCIFSWLMIAHPADDRLAVDIYHLPSWIILTTLTIPYLYIWYRGIAGVYFISSYQRNVKGKLYRQSLRYLSAGVLTVISVNVLIQFITTISARLFRLNLTPILLIVYVLVGLYALGFGWIAAGAKRLRKIEEV